MQEAEALKPDAERLKDLTRALKLRKAYNRHHDSDSDGAASADSFSNDYEIPLKVL